MKYILFGVSCVGKTTLGKLIAETLGYEFSDTDERIREIYGRSIDFQNQFPFVYERDRRKAEILSFLLDSVSDNCILSYMPCWYARPLNGILNRRDTVGIRLVDSPDNIFDRLIYTDDNDQLLPDDGYKEKHASRIIRDIKGDCKAMNKAMINIPLIFDINGRSAEEAAADLAGIIKAINKRESATVPASSRCEPGWSRLVEKLS